MELNRGTLKIGGVGTLAVVVLMGLSEPAEQSFSAVLGCLHAILLFGTCVLFRAQRGIGERIPIALFGGMFTIGTFAAICEKGGGVPHAVVVALLGFTNVLFHEWLKVPSLAWVRLQNEMEGLRWYLGVAEREELDAQYRPESNPERFARFLPYALALDVEQAWSERFARALTPEQFEQAQPGWYRASAPTKGARTSSFVSSGSGRSLTSSISSASTPPGSTSGRSRSRSGSSSRSSGRSGGGGGGGGGGGW